ncbi:exodeoxyribonuclease III [Teichococcus oryzae]|uniref:Exodeoxyribonuclease III n=1 Tax=Teichococcus oryzae TaxID=1608942 RepID=A0A5B2TLZ3_9PROT|nr:exodeoxyribonuclease III [Pseudoroseomonas oryzae]KAA2215214.1 exodeoxyribonuclease III [Pseudoroseomonas oryzae]
MRIASFNVNSVRKRVPHIGRFLQKVQPDLLFLQELKCKTEECPTAEFRDLGYQVHAVGQPGGRNGVAVLSRIPFEVVCEALEGEAADDHARYIEVVAGGAHLAGIYLPNGNSGGAEGYAYKLRWMERLRRRAAGLLDRFQPLAILGDFNVCPTALDLAPGALPPTDALVRPKTRAAFQALCHIGLTDAVRALHPGNRIYTYWDYGPSFEANRGLRIDHALLSPELAERLVSAQVEIGPRAEEQPSDHTPLVIELA